MTNNLPSLLAELSEIASDVCQKKPFSYYAIGDYLFWHNVEGDFVAEHKRHKDIMYTGQPAYDWLQGALMRVIKSKDWGYKIQSPANTGLTFAKVYFLPDGIFSSDGDNATEALLTALIQAIKGG